MRYYKLLQSSILKVFTLLFLGMIAYDLSARKVICIDQGSANDSFLNGAEGRARATANTGDHIQRGGSLTACINELNTNDTLVIIAHGYKEDDGGFNWGGFSYDGFGNDDGEMPVPSGLSGKKVHIRFISCWSKRDPDGTGPKKSIADRLKDKCGPQSTSEGFTDYCQPQICWKFTGGTVAQRKAAEDTLKSNSDWMKKPPHNRPNAPTPNDLTAAQAQVSAKAPGVTVTLTYYKAENKTQVPPTNNSQTTVTEESCGFYTAMSEDLLTYGEVGYSQNFIFPNGIWRSDEDVTYVFPDADPVQMRNLRIWNTMPVFESPDPFAPVPLSINYQGFVQISTDGGDSWNNYDGFGILNAIAQPDPDVMSDSRYYDLILENMQVTFNGPEGEFILFNGSVPDPGIIVVEPEDDPETDPDWWVESFFDVYFNLDNSMGQIGFPTRNNLVYLKCATPVPGCDQPDALDFEPCSLESLGCDTPVFGCTDPLATNYSETANMDNGDCFFPGCTDVSASNFNPLADEDDDSCEYSSPCREDLNNDQVINTGDLVLFLTVFGSVCDVVDVN